MDPSRFSISARDLYDRMGGATAPTIVDVRTSAAFDADETMLAGAVRVPLADIETYAKSADRRVIVYCVHGHEVSQNAAATLRTAGMDARYLEGGIDGWTGRHLPTRRKLPHAGRWITRQRPKVDRVACPWLVRRFIDPNASFLYVLPELVFEVAKEKDAIPYDIPGAEPFSQDGERCSFDGFIRVFAISDPALDRLATIVRGADTGELGLAPQCSGLLSVSLGLSAIHSNDDQAMLEQAMVVYDALYAWCRFAHAEHHQWAPQP
jgi:rhodanese-related sulfurtransferase